MANIIKEELIDVLDDFIEKADPSKKPGLKKVRTNLKEKNISDTPDEVDRSAYYLFLVSQGHKILTPANKERIHQYYDTVTSRLSKKLTSEEPEEKPKENIKKGPPSGTT